MTEDRLAALRTAIRAATLADEGEVIPRLVEAAGLDGGARAAIGTQAVELVEAVRSQPSAGMLEGFLAEYALSSEEGVALMCLAEALLRVPDDETADLLIEDKLTETDWLEHFRAGNPALVNVSALALTLTGEVLRDAGTGFAGTLRGVVQRLGEPVIRAAVRQAMKILGNQFVLGRDIEEAVRLARRREGEGFSYSYDMLGEAARTEADARRYRTAYAEAISVIAMRASAGSVRDNPGVSVKLSALHPRYEISQRARVMDELVERVLALALMARGANMGFNIDAEEAERLDLSLDVIAAVLADPRLAGWDGFGLVVQAYGPRAGLVIDWAAALAEQLDRRLMVRLVKGAYWDSEVKRAQVLGLDGFPVFTRKAATDVSYIANARKLLEQRHRLYPQFATHNAHTAAAVLHLAQALGAPAESYEFQRLHGMGERLHDLLARQHGVRSRIYAPVGRHADLLAYLVRRLLENGANGSFVHMIADRDVPAAQVAADPFDAVELEVSPVTRPADLFLPERRNSRGIDLSDPAVLERLERRRKGFAERLWRAGPLLDGTVSGDEVVVIANPANGSPVGEVVLADRADVETAIDAAERHSLDWSSRPVAERADLLVKASDLFENHASEFYALLAREAGKTIADAVAEVREAVDFLRYYAAEARRLGALAPRGVFACISPWNFPLAIFTGQVAAALVVGNSVIAKPAEETPLVAQRAVELMVEAGIPKGVLQLLPGSGEVIGQALCSDPRIGGVAFTGSFATAKAIDTAMADTLAPDAPLIAETGGINAMIVDSTALPEQAVRDIIASAFQSAGQRCSALRLLYVQEEAADRLLEMLKGAMDELVVGDPWQLSTDIGPLISNSSLAEIRSSCAYQPGKSTLLKQLSAPESACFFNPLLVEVGGIADIGKEIFGPVLHIARFKAEDLDAVISAINASGYGLTFGLHSRIDSRVTAVSRSVQAGNIYVNRNQIGAVVGSQPFGGEGLSGTGPKAGGPDYLYRFTRPADVAAVSDTINGLSGLSIGFAISAVDQVRAALEKAQLDQQVTIMPGPTGESNRLHRLPRGVILCLGPDEASARLQAQLALAQGNGVLVIAPGAQRIADELGVDGAVIGGTDKRLSPAAIEAGLNIDAVMHFGDEAALRPWRQALARREGAIVPLISNAVDSTRLRRERHICIDTTAAGGNAQLLAGRGG